MSEATLGRSKGADEKFCSDCGEVIKAKAEICPKCGVRQMPAPNPLATTAPNGKSRIAAALLAFFLGIFGIHKFYLGQIGWGLLYLAFFWTAIPAIIGIVEFVILLTMRDEEFNERFGKIRH
jgi:TM2 domain-containing membrane protein YozV